MLCHNVNLVRGEVRYVKSTPMGSPSRLEPGYVLLYMVKEWLISHRLWLIQIQIVSHLRVCLSGV